MRLLLLSGACIGGLAAANPPIAQAQQTGAGTAAPSPGDASPGATGDIEEVVVTARRRAELLKDVPIAVSAFTAAKLDNLGLQDTADIALFTPGLEYTNENDGRNDRGADRQLIFRGLNLSSNAGITAGALTFIDGAAVFGGEAAVSLDTDRVEVLRGPQNVYFGRSTFSGAVNYVTKAIPDTWSGTVEAGLAEYSTYSVQASVGGPVTDTFRIRATGLQNDTDGQYQNQFDGAHEGQRETTGGSGAFEADVADNFHIKGYLSYEGDNDGISAEGNIPPMLDNCKRPAAATNNYYCGALPNANNIVNYTNTNFGPTVYGLLFHPPSGDNLNGNDFSEQYGVQRHSWNMDIHFDYEFDDGTTLTELSAYHRDHIANIGDATPQNTSIVANPTFTAFDYGFDQLFTDQSHEIRLTSAQDQRLRWTAGGNVVKVDELTQIVAAYGFPPYGSAPVWGGPSYTGLQATTTYGVFAGGYFDIVDGLTLTFEGRYQWDQELSGGTTRPQVSLQQTYRSFQPRTSLDYKFTPDLTGYISYASGVRPGGFNSALLGQPESVIAQFAAQAGVTGTAYKEESLDTYEIGIKGSILDHTVSGSLTGYYGDLTNMQVSQNVTYITPGGGAITEAVTSNLGKVTIHGIEAEGAWRATRDLTLSGTFAWNYTDILAYPCTACLATIGTTNIDGNRLPLAPTYSGTLAADYTYPQLVGDWNAFGHIDYINRGKRFIDFENLSYIKDSSLVNLRVGVTKDDLKLELYVTNLLNDTTLTDAGRYSNIVTGGYDWRVALPDKRTLGARVRYSFSAGHDAPATQAATYTPPPAQAPMPATTARSYMVFFDFNKSDLTPRAAAIVDQAAKNAGPAKVTQLTVTGHTDTVGSDAYNMRLSRRRAESVAAELEANGIASSEIEIVAKGKHDLLVPTKDGVREPQNRRVQIVYGGGATS